MQCLGTRYDRGMMWCSATIKSDFQCGVFLHQAVFEASIFWHLILRDVEQAVQLAVARQLHLTALCLTVSLIAVVSNSS